MTPEQHDQVEVTWWLGAVIIGMTSPITLAITGDDAPGWAYIVTWVFAYIMASVASRSLAKQFRKEDSA